MAEVSIVAAIKDFFGDHPTNPELRFISEFKQLTPKDKADLREMLIVEGYEIAPIKAA